MLRSLSKSVRHAVLPVAMIAALGTGLHATPAKASGIVEVAAIGVGMVVGAAAVTALTAGMGPALMVGPVAAAEAGAAGAGAGAGMMAAEGGFMGHMAHMGTAAVTHITLNPWRAGAVALGALAGGYVFGLPF